MCTGTSVEFVKANLTKEEVNGRSVLEVGSRNVNGSCRPIIESLGPSEYIGIDIVRGAGVDMVCSAEDLILKYGEEKFDLVVSTENLEHIMDWKKVVGNIKRILKPNGILLITTRSKGFPYHGFPYDFWRFELEDMKIIFSDFKIDVLIKDPSPKWDGVFIKATKPGCFSENDLTHCELYSIIKKKSIDKIKAFDVLLFKITHHLKNIIPESAKIAIKSAIGNNEKL